MNLSLAVPWAAGLAVLGALPLIAHLSRRMPTERIAFGAMMLLRRLTRRLRRRQRLRDPLILALRLLAALLVGLAATGPVVRWQAEVPVTEGLARHVLVVDVSRSMALSEAGSTLLARAVGEARDFLAERPAGTRAALVLCGPTPRVPSPELTDDLGTVRGRLEDLVPSKGPCDLRASLLEARRLLGGEVGAVHVFTDEAGPVMIPAADEEIGRLVAAGHALVPHPIHAAVPRNLRPIHAVWEEGPEGGKVVVRVRSQGPGAREVPCEVDLPDGERIRVFVAVEADADAQTSVTLPRDTPGGVGVVRCDDPDLPLDDRRWFHLPGREATEVIAVDGEPGDTPTDSEVYFIERALAPWGGLRSGITVRTVGPTGLPALDPERHAAVFLANVADPRPMGQALRAYVREGGHLVVGLGQNVAPDRYESALGAVLPARLGEPVAFTDVKEPWLPVVLPDARHPDLAPFARDGRAALTRIASHRAYRLEPYQEGDGIDTLLSYEGGAPALVVRRVGRGKVFLWTSTFDYHWSNLALQSAFLPLIQQMAGAGSTTRLATAEALVGETAAVPLPDDVTRVWVRGPEGQDVAATVEDHVARFAVDAPGPWSVQMPDGPVLGYAVVHLDPVEGDVAVVHTVRESGAEAAPELFTRQAEVAPWMLAGALLCGLLASALARRPAPSEDAEDAEASADGPFDGVPA